MTMTMTMTEEQWAPLAPLIEAAESAKLAMQWAALRNTPSDPKAALEARITYKRLEIEADLAQRAVDAAVLKLARELGYL